MNSSRCTGQWHITIGVAVMLLSVIGAVVIAFALMSIQPFGVSAGVDPGSKLALLVLVLGFAGFVAGLVQTVFGIVRVGRT